MITHSTSTYEAARRLGLYGITSPLPLSDLGQFLTEALQSYVQDLGSYKNIHVKSELAREIITDTAIRNLVYKLFGPGYILWRTNCFHRSPSKIDGHSGVPMHHDKHFQDGESMIDFEEIGKHLSIIVALDDINASNGLFSYIPRSMTNLSGYNRDARPFHRRTFDDHFPPMPGHLMVQEKLMAIPRSHFCLFHSALLHGSVQSQKPGEAGRTSFVGRVARRECKVPPELATPAEIVSFC